MLVWMRLLKGSADAAGVKRMFGSANPVQQFMGSKEGNVRQSEAVTPGPATEHISHCVPRPKASGIPLLQGCLRDRVMSPVVIKVCAAAGRSP